MKNERKMLIVLGVLCFIAGISMIINAFTDINYLDVVFYVLMGIYWIVFGVYMYMCKKAKDIEKNSEDTIKEEK